MQWQKVWNWWCADEFCYVTLQKVKQLHNVNTQTLTLILTRFFKAACIFHWIKRLLYITVAPFSFRIFLFIFFIYRSKGRWFNPRLLRSTRKVSLDKILNAKLLWMAAPLVCVNMCVWAPVRRLALCREATLLLVCEWANADLCCKSTLSRKRCVNTVHLPF